MPRPGYLTPSTFYDLMSNGRGTDEMGQTALKVVERLAMDMIGVDRPEDVEARPLAWGVENEWEAVELYQERKICTVKSPDFKVSPSLDYVGGTCDGLVGKSGGIEVKCPYNSSEHLANMMYGKQIKQYLFQIQGYIHIYELDWMDFVSFDPRYPDDFKLAVYRVERDDDTINLLLDRCKLAYVRAQEIVHNLRGRVVPT